WNAHGWKIFRRDVPHCAPRTGIARPRRASLDAERSRRIASRERQASDNSSRTHARQIRNFADRLAEKLSLLRRFFVLAGRQRKSRRHHAFRLKARAHLLQPRKALQKQSRAHQ